MNAYLKGFFSNAKKQLMEKINDGVDKIKNIFTKSQVEEIKQEIEYLQPNGEILLVTRRDGKILAVTKYPARYYYHFLEQDLEVYSMDHEGDEHITFVNEL